MKALLINIFILAFLVSCETITTIDGPQTRERYKDFLSQYYKTDYQEDLFFSVSIPIRFMHICLFLNNVFTFYCFRLHVSLIV